MVFTDKLVVANIFHTNYKYDPIQTCYSLVWLSLHLSLPSEAAADEVILGLKPKK